VVAVVGRVSVGKSSFINALLGEDIALVGATEVTSTINRIVYSERIADAAHPIRCHWRNRPPENVSREFVQRLQGSDEAALQLAEAIDYLEYPVCNPYLQQITLVDTPGLSSALDTHQNQTAGIFGLRGHLRARHTRETERISSTADAVIFLIRQVALEDARAFLEEFQQVMGGRSRAFNAVGVMAQIDVLPGVLAKRRELAAKIADQLKESLSAVVPISAGLQRALDLMMQGDGAPLRRLMTALRRIPPRRLAMLLSSDELFAEEEFDDCPISAPERKALLGQMPWTVFTTIARAVANPNASEPEIAAYLTDIAGFAPLKDLLDKRFYQRGQMLRRHRIINDAFRILETIRYQHIEVLRQQEQAEEAHRLRLLDYLRQTPGDASIRRELEALVNEHIRPAITQADALASVQRIDRQLSAYLLTLEEESADLEALQQVDNHPDRFTEEERAELRALFGFYGMEQADRLPPGRSADLAYVQTRAQTWYALSRRERDPVRALAAQRATERYGLILAALLAPPGAATGEEDHSQPPLP
jgi:GTPase Era involved in 16S rRNA processing